MNDFVKGFVKVARETTIMYFAPVTATWQWLLKTKKVLLRAKTETGGSNGIPPSTLKSTTQTADEVKKRP